MTVGPEVDNSSLVTVAMGKSGRHHRAERSAERALCGRKEEMIPAAESKGLECALCRDAEAKRARAGRKTAIAFHAFRHTCASLLFAEGRNVKQVSEGLGHADPAFTMRVYISLLDEGLGDGLELTPTPSETSLLHGVIPSVDPDASAAA